MKGGARAGAGRKPGVKTTIEPQERLTITIARKLRDKAARIGDGNVSRGIRHAITEYPEETSMSTIDTETQAQAIAAALREMGFTPRYRTDGEGVRATALIAAIRGKRPSREDVEVHITSDGVSIDDADAIGLDAAIADLRARFAPGA